MLLDCALALWIQLSTRIPRKYHHLFKILRLLSLPDYWELMKLYFRVNFLWEWVCISVWLSVSSLFFLSTTSVSQIPSFLPSFSFLLLLHITTSPQCKHRKAHTDLLLQLPLALGRWERCSHCERMRIGLWDVLQELGTCRKVASCYSNVNMAQWWVPKWLINCQIVMLCQCMMVPGKKGSKGN